MQGTGGHVLFSARVSIPGLKGVILTAAGSRGSGIDQLAGCQKMLGQCLIVECWRST
jgi:hypothetical protein